VGLLRGIPTGTVCPSIRLVDTLADFLRQTKTTTMGSIVFSRFCGCWAWTSHTGAVSSASVEVVALEDAPRRQAHG